MSILVRIYAYHHANHEGPGRRGTAVTFSTPTSRGGRDHDRCKEPLLGDRRRRRGRSRRRTGYGWQRDGDLLYASRPCARWHPCGRRRFARRLRRCEQLHHRRRRLHLYGPEHPGRQSRRRGRAQAARNYLHERVRLRGQQFHAVLDEREPRGRDRRRRGLLSVDESSIYAVPIDGGTTLPILSGQPSQEWPDRRR